MRKRTVAAGVVALALALLGAWLWFPASVPRGQQPLTTLQGSNVSEFASAFDQAPAGARLVLLVAPT